MYNASLVDNMVVYLFYRYTTSVTLDFQSNRTQVKTSPAKSTPVKSTPCQHDLKMKVKSATYFK